MNLFGTNFDLFGTPLHWPICPLCYHQLLNILMIAILITFIEIIYYENSFGQRKGIFDSLRTVSPILTEDSCLTD